MYFLEYARNAVATGEKACVFFHTSMVPVSIFGARGTKHSPG